MKKKMISSLLMSFLVACSVSVPQTTFAQKTSKKVASTAAINTKLLTEVLDNNKAAYAEGKVADYIPELGKADAQSVALAVVKENGEVVSVGDVNQRFTIQSISKIVSLMVALQERGEEEVFSHIGYFGTDKPFNHFANIETMGQPLNPMMNAGAILTTSMLGEEGEEGFMKILDMVRYIAKNDKIDYSKEVYQSEKETGHRNRGMFYLLKNNGLINGEENQLDNYFKQCSIEVNAEDIAKIGYFFANGCVRFDGDTKYKNEEIAKIVQSQMLIAGMYEFSGEYARRVGLPSKSGVGGGITVSVPHKIGIGAYSPALDSHGNSVVGYKMILELVNKLNLSLF